METLQEESEYLLHSEAGDTNTSLDDTKNISEIDVVYDVKPRISAKERLLPVLASISVNRYLLQSSSTTESSLSRSEDDENKYSFAARFVSAAMEGRNIVTAGDMFEEHRLSKLLSHFLYKRAIHLTVLAHLLIPIWDCNFDIVLIALNLSILGVYLMDIILQGIVYGIGLFWDKKWEAVFAIIVIAQSITIIWSTVEHYKSDDDTACILLHISEALRPYLLICKMQTLRHVFTNVLRTMWSTKSILGIALVVLSFYSVLGAGLFNSSQVSGYSSDGDNFDSFWQSLLTLYILTTEENFPFVTESALNQRPIVAFMFFISFLFIFLIIVLPLMLGTVLDSYASNHALQVSSKRSKARRALLVAYYIIDDNGVRGINFNQFSKVLSQTSTPFPPQQIRYIWSKIVKKDNQPNPIEYVLRVQDFLELVKYLHKTKFKKIHRGSAPNALPQNNFWNKFQAKAQYIIHRTWFNKVSQINTLCLAMMSMWFNPRLETTFIACYEGSISSTESCQPFTTGFLFDTIFLLIFTLEIVMLMIAKGPLGFLSHSKWNLMDGILVLISWASYFSLYILILIGYNFEQHTNVGDVIELPRAIRILRIITVFPFFKGILGGLSSIFSVVGQIVLLYCSIGYSFAVIGMSLFKGGGIPSDEMGVRFSFSSFSDSLYTMLLLTVKNNWNDVLYPLIIYRGRVSAIFFVAYILFCSTILLDVLIGVVIEGIQVAAMYEIERKLAKYGVAPGGSLNIRKSNSKMTDKSRKGSSNKANKWNTSKSTMSSKSYTSDTSQSDHSTRAVSPLKAPFSFEDQIDGKKANETKVGADFVAPLLKKPDTLAQQSMILSRVKLMADELFTGEGEDSDAELSDSEVIELESTMKIIENRMKEHFSKSGRLLRESTSRISSKIGNTFAPKDYGTSDA